MRCSKCGGFIARDLDELNNWEYVCLNCGYRPAIKPLGQWYESMLRKPKK